MPIADQTTRLTTSAFTALAGGELDVAIRDCRRAVEIDPMGINSAAALAIYGHAALWQRDLVSSREALASMERIRGRAMAAQRRTAEAGIAALEGRTDEAAEIYRDAIERWRTLESALDLALCELDLVLLLGADHPDATVAKEARDILTQIGAQPFLQRLNEATEYSGD
jgi:tetratricopeptide (TPR) repeat protein